MDEDVERDDRPESAGGGPIPRRWRNTDQFVEMVRSFSLKLNSLGISCYVLSNFPMGAADGLARP